MTNKYTQEHIDELIAKKLTGEQNAEERKALEFWRSASPENAKYLAQFEKLWNYSADNNAFENKTAEAWVNVNYQINNKKETKFIISFKRALAIAASIVLIAVVWFVVKDKNNRVIPAMETARALHIETGNTEITTTLPDKTLVILQPHCTLDADTNFGKTHRTVVLKGQAYFRTVHGNKYNFTVKTGQLTVEDIGTAFYIQMQNNKPLVWVAEGSVKVKSPADSQLLVKNDSMVFDTLKMAFTRINAKPLHLKEETSPQDKKLVFEKTALSKVVETLNYTYQSDIRIGSEKIANCTVAGTFINEKLGTILEVLRETLNIEIIQEGNIIYLKGKGCQ